MPLIKSHVSYVRNQDVLITNVTAVEATTESQTVQRLRKSKIDLRTPLISHP